MKRQMIRANESYECVMSRDESSRTYELSHVTGMERVMSHVCTESCHTYEMSHVTHMNESCHTFESSDVKQMNRMILIRFTS